MASPAELFMEAARDAANRRHEFSEAFLRFKGAKKDVTDRQAEHQAYIECGVARDMAEAALEVQRSILTGRP